MKDEEEYDGMKITGGKMSDSLAMIYEQQMWIDMHRTREEWDRIKPMLKLDHGIIGKAVFISTVSEDRIDNFLNLWNPDEFQPTEKTGLYRVFINAFDKPDEYGFSKEK